MRTIAKRLFPGQDPLKEILKISSFYNSKSGIILTGTDAAYGYAEVISVGPGLFTATGDKIPMTCRVGDTVMAPMRLLSGKNGNEVKLDDVNYLLVRESEIAMVSC